MQEGCAPLRLCKVVYCAEGCGSYMYAPLLLPAAVCVGGPGCSPGPGQCWRPCAGGRAAEGRRQGGRGPDRCTKYRGPVRHANFLRQSRADGQHAALSTPHITHHATHHTTPHSIACHRAILRPGSAMAATGLRSDHRHHLQCPRSARPTHGRTAMTTPRNGRLMQQKRRGSPTKTASCCSRPRRRLRCASEAAEPSLSTGSLSRCASSTRPRRSTTRRLGTMSWTCRTLRACWRAWTPRTSLSWRRRSRTTSRWRPTAATESTGV